MSLIRTLRERKETLSVADLAKLMDVTEATVQRWVRKGEFPSIRIGDVIRVDPSMLADWFEMQNPRFFLLKSFIKARDKAAPDYFKLTRKDAGMDCTAKDE
jgi:excisionase family DNA binding protein